MRKFIAGFLILIVALLSITTSGFAAPAATSANLIKNGDFETPIVPIGGFIEYGKGQTFGGWHVSGGSIDLVNTQYFEAGHGAQSVDLNGNTDGTIYQDIKTQKGKSYQLIFLFAKNPVCNVLEVEKMYILWATTNNVVVRSQKLVFNMRSEVNLMRWAQVKIKFTSVGSTTRLAFDSNTPGYCGPTIDDVIVV